ncbi:T9SS type A sorting domain-containing protein [Halocola ammonii]
MKTVFTFLTLYFLLVSITGFSQEHWSLPPEGSIYTNSLYSISAFGEWYSDRTEQTWQQEVGADGHTWRQYHVPDPNGDESTTYLIREEEGKWFLKNTEWEEQALDEFPLYDWTAEVGDTILSTSVYEIENGPMALRVDSINEQEYFDGSTRKVFHLTNLEINMIFPVVWNEGIGPLNDALLNAAGTSLADGGEFLICAHHGSTQVYESIWADGLANYENCMWDPVGVEEIKQTELEVFPNPVNDILSVRVVDGKFGKTSKIEIADLHGRIVLSEESARGKNIIELDLSSLNAGVYLLRMTTENSKTLTEKIVVN